MKFLLDEDMPPAVAVGLRERGCDAISVHDLGRLGLRDEEQLIFAGTQNRIFVTYDRDDFQVLDAVYHLRGTSHRGIRWVSERTIPRRAIGTLVKALLQVAGMYPEIENLCLPLPYPGDTDKF
ncbi:MAG TPA: DUF5615 family PIN-like protein [Chloroflexota bacterium]|nr:DUF5615 family PIN-like protein [Chloroflexota bacterium]